MNAFDHWGDAYLFTDKKTGHQVAVFANTLHAAKRTARLHLALLR